MSCCGICVILTQPSVFNKIKKKLVLDNELELRCLPRLICEVGIFVLVCTDRGFSSGKGLGVGNTPRWHEQTFSKMTITFDLFLVIFALTFQIALKENVHVYRKWFGVTCD